MAPAIRRPSVARYSQPNRRAVVDASPGMSCSLRYCASSATLIAIQRCGAPTGPSAGELRSGSLDGRVQRSYPKTCPGPGGMASPTTTKPRGRSTRSRTRPVEVPGPRLVPATQCPSEPRRSSHRLLVYRSPSIVRADGRDGRWADAELIVRATGPLCQKECGRCDSARSASPIMPPLDRAESQP